MIISLEIRDFIREEIHEQQERLIQKELCHLLGYSRWTLHHALANGRFSIELLHRFAKVFPALKQTEAYITIIQQTR